MESVQKFSLLLFFAYLAQKIVHMLKQDATQFQSRSTHCIEASSPQTTILLASSDFHFVVLIFPSLPSIAALQLIMQWYLGLDVLYLIWVEHVVVTTPLGWQI